MSEEIRERLSALVDGELGEPEAVGMLDRLNVDAELKQVWERYHLVSDVIRNNLPVFASVDLVDRVKQSLNSEPVPFRPIRRRIPASLKPAASPGMIPSST